MLGMQYGLHDRLHRVCGGGAAADHRETNQEAVLQNFKTKLDLSAEQTDQIAVVLQDYSHYYESLQDQLDDLRSTGLSRIRPDPPARPAREIRKDADRAGASIKSRAQKIDRASKIPVPAAYIGYLNLLISGPPASGKSRAALEHFRSQTNRLLIVPTATMAEHTRHLLARSGFPVRPREIRTLANCLEDWSPMAAAPAALAGSADRASIGAAAAGALHRSGWISGVSPRAGGAISRSALRRSASRFGKHRGRG